MDKPVEEINGYILFLFTVVVIYISYKISKRIQDRRVALIPEPAPPTTDAETVTPTELWPETAPAVKAHGKKSPKHKKSGDESGSPVRRTTRRRKHSRSSSSE